jgi:hypothetical protein
MNSTWYNVAVVVLWLATMGWLVSQKVAPVLLVGDPPSYRTIIEAQQEDPLVGWSMEWDGRPMGWVLNTTLPMRDEMTEVRNLVHFDDFPLREVIPDWLLSKNLSGDEAWIRLTLEAKSRLVFDPLKRLSQFESSLGFPGVDDVVKVKGTVDGSELHVSAHSGDFTYETDSTLPQDALLNDTLSPQATLPGLRVGQNWNVGVYSPLRPTSDPLELLHATVEGVKPVLWGDRVVEALLVVYRDDPGAGTANAEKARGRLWVLDDGTVVKQEVAVLDSILTFSRLNRQEAAELAASVGNWE